MSEDAIQTLKISNAELLGEAKRLLQAGKQVTLTVRGNSMLPFIRSDKDQVELQQEETYGLGDIVLAEIMPGTYVLHRIFELHDTQPTSIVTLMGDGNLKQTEQCTYQHIVGRVRTIIKNNKRIDPQSTSARRKAVLWRSLLPVRRILLGIYRRI